LGTRAVSNSINHRMAGQKAVSAPAVPRTAALPHTTSTALPFLLPARLFPAGTFVDH
jgi:hypothetical protein